MKRVKGESHEYEYNGWQVYALGGFCTIKRFSAHKGDLLVWAFRLKDLAPKLDAVDRGQEIEALYRKPLYT